MCKSIFRKLESVVRFSILTAGLIAVGGVPALAMGGGNHGGGQHMKGITGSGIGTGSVENASGNFQGTGLGNGSFATDILDSANTIDNGSGGTCAGASGTITLTAANGNTVTLGVAGLRCDVAASSGPATFNGSYLVQSGVGRFANAKGTGTTVVTDDGTGNVYIDLVGAMGMGGGGHMGGGGGGGGHM